MEGRRPFLVSPNRGIIPVVTSESRDRPLFDTLVTEVAGATSLKEGPRGVETVLRAIFQSEPTGIKSLSRQARLPVPVLAAVLGELAKRGLVQRGEGVSLTAKGRAFVEREMGLTSRQQWLCNTCHGRTIYLPSRLRPVVEKLSHYTSRAPAVDTALDQALSTPESAVRRALFMIQQGAVEGKRILVLGDDDSLSLAIGLLGRILHPEGLFARRVTVIESDPRWIDHLNDVSNRESLGIETIQSDLRDPLPEALRGAYDTFETDPPYTLPGLKLFVSRGVEALAPGGGQGFLSMGARSPEEMLACQRALTEMGLVIDQMVPNFNVYQGASLLGGTSHLYQLQVAGEARPLVTGPFHEENIYTGERHPTLRIYRCMACRREFTVGVGGQFPTIEKLKAAGCLTCGGESFEWAGRQASS